MRSDMKNISIRKIVALLLTTGCLTSCSMAKLPFPSVSDSTETGGYLTAASMTKYDATFLQLFDTVTTISGYAEDKETFRHYAEELKSELTVYHQLYDIYNSYEGINNIKTINDMAGIEPVEVDERIIGMLELSKEMYRESDGAFNVAMGSVLTIWHDFRTAGIENPEEAMLPPMELLKAAAEHTDMELVEIDREASTVYLPDPEMSLDVGAIAKGYATEQVCQKLEADGLKQGLVSVGGNVRSIGRKGSGEKWMVGIQNPDLHSDADYLHRVALEDMSLVSSGSYQRYYTVAGKTYHHIIHPETLMPWDAYVSVTILCRDSGMADALSTSVFNMPLEAGMTFIEQLDGVEALWIEQDGTEHFSSGFKNYLFDE